jgi:hypothetical protein
VHDGWVADYDGQNHWAHRERSKTAAARRRRYWGGFWGVRYHSEDLERAFFSTRFTRKLDSLGYATLFRRWRLYGEEEGLAGNEAALWLHAKNLTVEYAAEPLSRYDVEPPASGVGTGWLLAVRRPTLFETSYPRSWPQPKLFGLDALGEDGWLKVLKLDEYAPRRPRGSLALQQVLFAYKEAI